MAIPHVPSNAAELEAAIHDSVLVESLIFDAKAGDAVGEKANRSIAIDLAAMAVNGGLIAVGIAQEEANGAKVLVPRPVPLAGLRERVSSIGLSRVDPPLTVVTRELPVGDTDTGAGYLLILVPPSPDAPHMVDNKYRGRGETTNYVMGDAEVRRLQAQRWGGRLDIDVALERAIAADPPPDEFRTQTHLFVVARPTVPTNAAMLQERIGDDWRKWIRETIVSGSTKLTAPFAGWPVRRSTTRIQTSRPTRRKPMSAVASELAILTREELGLTVRRRGRRVTMTKADVERLETWIVANLSFTMVRLREAAVPFDAWVEEVTRQLHPPMGQGAWWSSAFRDHLAARADA